MLFHSNRVQIVQKAELISNRYILQGFVFLIYTFWHSNYSNYFSRPQGQVVFSSWMSIFSGNGGVFDPSTPIYSFDGRNVMSDPAWWVGVSKAKMLNRKILWLAGYKFHIHVDSMSHSDEQWWWYWQVHWALGVDKKDGWREIFFSWQTDQNTAPFLYSQKRRFDLFARWIHSPVSWKGLSSSISSHTYFVRKS